MHYYQNMTSLQSKIKNGGCNYVEGLKWDRLRCGDSARTSLEECDAAAGHRVVFSVYSCVRNKNSFNTYKYSYGKIFS